MTAVSLRGIICKNRDCSGVNGAMAADLNQNQRASSAVLLGACAAAIPWWVGLNAASIAHTQLNVHYTTLDTISLAFKG